MFKGTQVWLITLMDLLLLMVCFYVIVFSDYLSEYKSSLQKTPFQDSAVKEKKSEMSTNLRIIYENLTNFFKVPENMEAINNDTVRIVTNIDFADHQSVLSSLSNLSSHIYNINRNLIKIQLLINFPGFVDECNANNKNIDQETKKLIEGSKKFRDLLASNANNENIIEMVDTKSNYPTNRGKNWLLVLDILAEPN